MLIFLNAKVIISNKNHVTIRFISNKESIFHNISQLLFASPGVYTKKMRRISSRAATHCYLNKKTIKGKIGGLTVTNFLLSQSFVYLNKTNLSKINN